MSVTETEQTIDVNLAATVPCSLPECAEQAVWAAKSRCAFRHPWKPVCDACRADMDREWLAMHDRPGDPQCVTHGLVLPSPPIEWRPL